MVAISNFKRQNPVELGMRYDFNFETYSTPPLLSAAFVFTSLYDWDTFNLNDNLEGHVAMWEVAEG